MTNPGIFKNQIVTFQEQIDLKHLSFFRRLAINHAHPTKLVLDIIGFLWMTYFLWENSLVTAIIFGFSFSVLGSFLTFKANTEELASTAFGKYVIARMHPANLTFQIIGYVVSMYGVWIHQASVILIGLSAVTLGHLWGWRGKVVP